MFVQKVEVRVLLVEVNNDVISVVMSLFRYAFYVRLGKVSLVPRLERVLPERDQTAAFLLITHATAAALESVAAQDEKQLSQLPPHKTSLAFCLQL